MKLRKIQIKKDKRGVLGMEIATGFIIGLLILIVVGILTVIVANALNDADTSVAGSNAANITNNVVLNSTTGIQTFFSNATTWFALLSVVVIILIVGVAIVVIRRFGGTGRGDL